MEKNRLLMIGCSLALTALPVTGQAASFQDGLEACVDALVTELATTNGEPLGARIGADSSSSKRRLGSREVIYLDARNPLNEEIVARADCMVDRKGEVVRLTNVPLDGANAEERSLSYY